MTGKPNGTSDRPIREVTHHLYGRVRQNHVQDVLDVLDALDLDFMPVVDDFGSGRVVGAMTRSNLEDTLGREGPDARVAQVSSVTLPTILDDNSSADVTELRGRQRMRGRTGGGTAGRHLRARRSGLTGVSRCPDAPRLARPRLSPSDGACSATTTPLHEQRLDAVVDQLIDPGVESVLDLGCGSGALLERLVARPGLRRIVGLDRSFPALVTANTRLGASGRRDPRVTLRQGTVTDTDQDLVGFDAAALVETIEHLEPGDLSRLERSLFIRLRPRRVVITTPNREYNQLYGLKSHELRHPHHRFEWDRVKFERWSVGAGDRNGYELRFEGLGPNHPRLGSPTQMAIFERIQE